MGKIRLMKQFMWGVAVYVIATGEHGPCSQHEEAGSQAETPHIATVPSMVACAEHILCSSPCAALVGSWQHYNPADPSHHVLLSRIGCLSGPAGWCSRHMWWGCFAGLCLVSPAPCTLSAHLQTPESQFQVAAAALVILLPLFVMADPGEGAVKAIIILQNIVLGGFLAMLFWIFR